MQIRTPTATFTANASNTITDETKSSDEAARLATDETEPKDSAASKATSQRGAYDVYVIVDI